MPLELCQWAAWGPEAGPKHTCNTQTWQVLKSRNQDATPPSTPLTPQFLPTFLPAFSLDINQNTFVNYMGSSESHASDKDGSITHESNEPISKIFHPLISGLYYSLACHDLTFLLIMSFSRAPLQWTWQQFASKYTSSSTYRTWYRRLVTIPESDRIRNRTVSFLPRKDVHTKYRYPSWSLGHDSIKT